MGVFVTIGQRRRARLSLVAVLLWLTYTGAVTAQDSEVTVPWASESPRIDGNVLPGEWAGALVTPLSDSSEALFLRDAEHLYVALHLSRKGFGSLCIQKDEQVRVLHASAALGTAVYTRDEDAWRLAEPFDFAMRGTGDSTKLQRKRTDFLEMHGWIASTVDMEGNETAPTLEYKIRLDGFDPETPVLGVVAMLLEPNSNLMRMPSTLDDGCGDPELVQGFAPEQERFNPAGWLHLDLGMEKDDQPLPAR